MSKITFLITSLSSGGAEHQLSVLCNFLIEQCDHLEIVTFADIPDHYTLNPNIKRIRIGINKSKISKLLSIWKYLTTSNSDTIIAFGQREALISLPAMILSNKHFVVGERNTNLHGFSYLRKFLANILYSRADVIIPNSYTQGRILNALFPKFETKLNVITNFTDVNLYRPSERTSDDLCRICVFARFAPQKNYLRFVDAVESLVKKTSKPFKIDWFGKIQSKNHIQCQGVIDFGSKIKKLHLEDYVEIHDAVSDVQNYLKNYDAFCLPSLFEGFSNSISEAICCGLPCLVSDVSDNYIMVRDGVNGYLFNPEDTESISDAILKFINTPRDKRKSMSLESRNIALKLFDKEKFINSYKKLILI